MSPRRFRSIFDASPNEADAIEDDAVKEIHAPTVAVDECRSDWTSGPNKQKTIKLLHLAAENGKAEVFADTALEIISVFQENGIAGLSAHNLAELLDSHYRLLPAAQRSSGELFLVKQKIAELAHEPN